MSDLTDAELADRLDGLVDRVADRLVTDEAAAIEQAATRLRNRADGTESRSGRWDDRIAASEDVYHDAREHWGYEAQTAMLAEETAELSAEASRGLNAKGSHDQLLKEYVDVRIMLEQFRGLFEPGELEAMVDGRMDRLEAMLEEVDRHD